MIEGSAGPNTHHAWNGAYRVGPAGDFDNPNICRVLLVGEDNPQSFHPEHALWASPVGVAGERLQSTIFAIPHATYYGLWRTNLCPPTSSLTGPTVGRWDLDGARLRASHLLLNPSPPWSTIVCLGRKVAGAFEYVLGYAVPLWDWVPYWDEDADRWFTIAAIPHPSGRSRLWNDPANYERARELMRTVAPEVPWGSLGRIPLVGQQGQ